MLETAKKASLTSQSAWLIFARVVGFVFSLVLPLLIVRRLSQEAVGVYRQSFQVAGDAAAILSLGFNSSAFYYFNRERDKRSLAVLNILLFHLGVGFLAFLVLLLFPTILQNLFQSDALVPLAPKIGLLIWLWLFSSFIEFAAVANQESRIGFVFIIVTQASKAVLMIGAVVAFETVDAIVDAALFQCLLQSLLLIVYLHSRFPRFWRSFDLKFFKEQAGYAIPFGMAGMLWTAQNSIHFYFVGNRFTESEYAIYAYGCFQIPLIAVLGESAAAVLLPRMSELQLKGDYGAMAQLIGRAIDRLAFYYFAIYAYLLVVSDVFITTLFTRSYAASIPIFVAYLSLIPLSIFLVDPIMRSFGGFGKGLVVLRVVFLSVLVVALFYAVDRLSLQGVVIIVVSVAAIDRFTCVFLSARKLGLRPRDLGLLKGVLKTAVAASCAGVISWFAYAAFEHYLPSAIGSASSKVLNIDPRLLDFAVGSVILALTLFVFVPVYLFVANALNIIDEKEKEILQRSWRFVTG